mgnify:CR=1 FL=1
MNWETSPLGKVTKILSGTTPESSNPAYWNGSHVWVTPTDLGKLDATVIATSARQISESGRESCNPPLIPKSAVVMSSRAPIGHLAIAGCDLYTNQGCKSFVCSSDLDAEFLYFTLKHRMGDIQALGNGSTFAEVSKSDLEAFEISFPKCIDEQHQIAAHLKAQLAEVEIARKAAQVQLSDTRLLRARMLKAFFAELDAAPKKKLGDYAPTTSGSTPSRGNKQYWQPAEIAWVKTGEVAFAPITATEEAISKLALAECSLSLLPPQTILIAMIGQGKTRGQSAILEIPATTNQNCFAVLPNDTWEPDFLYLWMKSSYQDLRDLSADRGGSQAALNGALMNALEVPAPSKAEQQHIVARIQAAMTEIDALENSSKAAMEDIKRLPSCVLAQAFDQQGDEDER